MSKTGDTRKKNRLLDEKENAKKNTCIDKKKISDIWHFYVSSISYTPDSVNKLTSSNKLNSSLHEEKVLRDSVITPYLKNNGSLLRWYF